MRPRGSGTGWIRGTVLPALHFFRALAGGPQARRHVAVPSGTRCTNASAGAMSSANPAPPRTTSGPNSWERRSLQLGPPRRRFEVTGADAGRRRWTPEGPPIESQPGRLDDGLPPGAPAQVGHQGPTRSAWRARRPGAGSGSGSVTAKRIASRCPGCRTRTGWPRWPPGRRPSAASVGNQPVEGRHLPTRTRRTGVTQATRGAPSTQTVQQPHWPWGLHPSLTERTAQSSRRRHRAGTTRRLRRSTSAPSTRAAGSVVQRLS
jgi:hypothetical protein